MAQALTVAVEGNPQMDRSDPYRVILDWVCGTGGAEGVVTDADIASTYAAAQKLINDISAPQPSKLQGYIKAIETIPGLNGDKTTACPTTLYDITLDDAYDYDVAGGSLADRSASLAETVVPSSPIPIDSEITLEITAAGDTKKGRIILFIDPNL
jgi:hypothetical protein